MNLIVGITGSTGVIYGIRMLETLGKLDVKTHLVMSEWAAKCILMETKYTIDQVQKLATTYSDPSNMASAISSGTHKSDGMIIAPCSMKTLAAISFGYDDTLVARAAFVPDLWYMVSIRMHFAAHSLMTRCVLTSSLPRVSSILIPYMTPVLPVIPTIKFISE